MSQVLESNNNSNKRIKKMSSTNQAGPVLVTGGCGYIGSHTIVCLLEQGYSVVVVDNLVNSSKQSLDRVAEIANLDEEARKQRLVFHEVDLCDKEALEAVFESSPKFSSCIHFAGLKVGNESHASQRESPMISLPSHFQALSLYFSSGCRRKYPYSLEVLPQQLDGNVLSVGTHGQIRMPYHCLFQFRHCLWCC